MTKDQIETELGFVVDAINRITQSKSNSYLIQGRQVTSEPANKLTALYERQKYLETLLIRLNRNAGLGGIPVRYGVPR